MLSFLSIFFAEFIAEMGDKTQFMLIALTGKYKTKDIIAGTLCAILLLNALAVLAGGFVASLIPEYLIKFIAGTVFIFFAISFFRPDVGKEEDANDIKISFAPLAVFITFFIAELGDKTQLTAITFGANAGLKSALLVWLACSLGLFAADMFGLFLGKIIAGRIDNKILNKAAALIFAIFGLVTLFQGASAFF